MGVVLRATCDGKIHVVIAQVDLTNRKLWPTTVLLQVLTDLVRDTPKDLLVR